VKKVRGLTLYRKFCFIHKKVGVLLLGKWLTAAGRQTAKPKETEIVLVVPLFFTSGKDQDIERLKRGGCYEREKQRTKGKQEGPTEKPQREEKDEEGEEEQVGWTVSMFR
jgi:hypothetical protein